MYFKIGALTWKIPMLESLFKKVPGIQECNFTKRDSNTGGFLWNLLIFRIILFLFLFIYFILFFSSSYNSKTINKKIYIMLQ